MKRRIQRGYGMRTYPDRGDACIMNILVTLNSDYIRPLKVMLKSLFMTNPDERFSIYLMHSSIPDGELDDLNGFVAGHGSQLHVIFTDGAYFQHAPVLLHYTKEMYYRLMAFRFLPQELERILYLDPDTLIINPVKTLYETDIRDYLYAAACHNRISIREINKIRFNSFNLKAYYNSGVLLMNLERQRRMIDESAIFQFVEDNQSKLIMPDQDILNALYSRQIKELDEKLYNYDARHYRYYFIKTSGQCDMDFVLNHTVILHFCGKKKPWKPGYTGEFHALYKYFESRIS